MKITILLPFLLVAFSCQNSTDIEPQVIMAPTVNLNDSSGKVLHHVFFWLKNPESESDKLLLKEGLQTLSQIPQVKNLQIGEPASTVKRDVVVNDWQVSELMTFDSSEDQDAYQLDPVHLAFVENYSHLWVKVVVYDMRLD
jgi:hypothetical protein